MCDYDTHYCKRCKKDYNCSSPNNTCPTLNRYEDANMCSICDFDMSIEEAVFQHSKRYIDEHIEDEEFDVEKE